MNIRITIYEFTEGKESASPANEKEIGTDTTKPSDPLLFPEPPKEDTTTCEDMLRVVLPMAKGWVKEHDVGSNKAIIEHAEEVLRLAAREVC